ncbi:P27 family phage terminase small subunit, partial [Guptibacillus hwajinpoensis]
RNAKSASLVTGNHISKTEKNLLAKKEKEIVGDSSRLVRGLEGLENIELKRLESKDAKELYDVLSMEASKSSALGNIHIHDLIDLANEYEYLKRYNKDVKKHGVVVFDGKRFSANPADKMRKDSLKVIRELKSFLGLSTVDIATLARQNAETSESNKFNNLFGEYNSDESIWEE